MTTAIDGDWYLMIEDEEFDTDQMRRLSLHDGIVEERGRVEPVGTYSVKDTTADIIFQESRTPAGHTFREMLRISLAHFGSGSLISQIGNEDALCMPATLRPA